MRETRFYVAVRGMRARERETEKVSHTLTHIIIIHTIVYLSSPFMLVRET